MIKFEDKSYWDKRKILREFVDNNLSISMKLHTVALEIKERLNDPIIDKLVNFNIIRKYLIEGYLVFVTDKKGNVIWKDQCNIVPRTDSNNDVVWDEMAWKDVVMTYKRYDLAYITPYDDNISYTHHLYNGGFYEEGKDDEYHIDMVLKSLSNNILNIDKVLKVPKNIRRAYKMKKIYDKIYEGERFLVQG